jgi:hypothetical protein
MPNIKSAKKRMELSRVANARNRANRSKIKTAIRRVREAEDKETAETQLRQAVAFWTGQPPGISFPRTGWPASRASSPAG